MSSTRLSVFTFLAAAFVGALGAGFMTPARAQTIEGTLMEVGSDRPISLGLVIMMTEEGDSITSGVTDGNGRFELRSEEPGSFVLLSSAFGFKETQAGVFELGSGGTMTIEFRVGAKAMPIEGILVELQRPAIQHQLIRNGYVRRLQRGLGHFITPYDIEHSPVLTSTDLFRGIPGVSVRTINGLSYQGESVTMLSANGFCTPTVYVDGVRMSPAAVRGMSLSTLIPISELDAVEIYRRPAEVPIEYAATGNQPGEAFSVCGILVLWTKSR